MKIITLKTLLKEMSCVIVPLQEEVEVWAEFNALLNALLLEGSKKRGAGKIRGN